MICLMFVASNLREAWASISEAWHRVQGARDASTKVVMVSFKEKVAFFSRAYEGPQMGVSINGAKNGWFFSREDPKKNG